jgi:lysozyme|tara:strand:- start:355 stop:798 length:444 start_codon:yes stop_codon:yes gene_type:complete
MNIEELQHQISIDEGLVEEIYLDHLGLPTFGIGHLILETDEEHGQEVGTPVSKERINQCFESDLQNVLSDCEILYPDFYELPEEAQQIIANMMFNMGRTRLSKFKGMKAGVDSRDWGKAAEEMIDSRWYNQVTNRAERLVNRMREIG